MLRVATVRSETRPWHKTKGTFQDLEEHAVLDQERGPDL